MSSNTNSSDNTGTANNGEQQTTLTRAERNRRSREKKKAARARNGTIRKKTSSFKGATEEMNAHVYECTSETDNRNQYTRTTEELLAYINKHIDKHKQDILYVIKNLEQPEIVDPQDPADDASNAVTYRWKQQLDRAII